MTNKRISLSHEDRLAMLYGDQACETIVRTMQLPFHRELNMNEDAVLKARCFDERLYNAVHSFLQKKRMEHRMKQSAVHGRVTRNLRPSQAAE